MASHSSQSSLPSRLSSRNTSKLTRFARPDDPAVDDDRRARRVHRLSGASPRGRRSRRPWAKSKARIFLSSSGSIAGFRSGPFPRCRLIPFRQDAAPALPVRVRAQYAGSTLAVMAEGQDVGRRRYDIPEGPLETALSAYQAASGVTVTFPADLVRGITSPGVSGVFTAEQALATAAARARRSTFRFTAPFAAVARNPHRQ